MSGKKNTTVQDQASALNYMQKELLRKVDERVSITDNGYRLLVFRRLLDLGVPPQRAASAVLKILNYSRKGSLLRNNPLIGALYLFLNPSLQGAFRGAKAIAVSKTTRAVVAGFLLLGLLQGLILDDDELTTIDSLPSSYESYLGVPFGDNYVFFTLPWVFAFFTTMGRNLMMAGRGLKPWEQAGWHIMVSAMRNFSPVDLSKDWKAVLPTIFQTYVEAKKTTDAETYQTGGEDYELLFAGEWFRRTFVAGGVRMLQTGYNMLDIAEHGRIGEDMGVTDIPIAGRYFAGDINERETWMVDAFARMYRDQNTTVRKMLKRASPEDQKAMADWIWNEVTRPYKRAMNKRVDVDETALKDAVKDLRAKDPHDFGSAAQAFDAIQSMAAIWIFRQSKLRPPRIKGDRDMSERIQTMLNRRPPSKRWTIDTISPKMLAKLRRGETPELTYAQAKRPMPLAVQSSMHLIEKMRKELHGMDPSPYTEDMFRQLDEKEQEYRAKYISTLHLIRMTNLDTD